MLLIKNLTIKDFKDHIMINDFSYSLGNNNKVGIIGEEGNGKSTLLKAIKDKKMIDNYTVISGTIETDIKHIVYFEQKLHINWNEQLIYEYLLKQAFDDIISAEAYNDLQYYEKLCKNIGLPNDFIQRDQTIGSLSGGERVKLQLLKLLGKPMELLLLDEPTNDLDIETLKWMEDFIIKLAIPVMFISHDETLLENSADTIIHLEQLNKKTKSKYTIYKGRYSSYIEHRMGALRKEEQLAKKEKQEYIKQKIKLNDQMNAVHDALNDTVRNPGLAAKLMHKMRNMKAQERRFNQVGYTHVDTTEEAIDVLFEPAELPSGKCIFHLFKEKLDIAGNVLLETLDLALYGRDKSVIIGRNGCGKSILIKYMYEHLKNRDDIRLCYMPQNYEDAFEQGATSITFLLETGDKADITRARELLGRMKFTSEEMEHTLADLSEGQKAKLFLLKAIKQKCNVLLLDEPTRNLSPLTNPVIRHMLKEFDGCILAVSHDRKLIDEVFSQQWLIQNKHVTVLKR